MTENDNSVSVMHFQTWPQLTGLDYDYTPPVWTTTASYLLTARFVETGSQYIIEIEMPGVDKKDIRVTASGSQINVSCTRRRKSNEPAETRVLESGISYGTLSRCFTLNSIAAPKNTVAVLQDGILTITVEKDESSTVVEVK